MDIWDRFGVSAATNIVAGGAGLLLLSLWTPPPGNLAAILVPLPGFLILGGAVVALLWSVRRGPHYVRLLASKNRQKLI